MNKMFILRVSVNTDIAFVGEIVLIMLTSYNYDLRFVDAHRGKFG